MHRNIENKVEVCVVEQKREKDAFLPTSFAIHVSDYSVYGHRQMCGVVWFGVVCRQTKLK